ncbi:hypothetical protein ACTXT7_001419 [Hymenolepis weldensis]
MMMKILDHPILGIENFMGQSRVLLIDIRRSSSGYAVYPRWLNNNGLKSLNMSVCICINSKALWKNGGVMMCPSLLTVPKTIIVAGNFVRMHNSWNLNEVCPHITIYHFLD